MGRNKQHVSKREQLRSKNKNYKATKEKQKVQSKEGKKDPTKRKELKKDPGLPNLDRFKQTFTARLERIAEKSERQRDRQKKDRERVLEEQRKQMSMHELVKNAMDRERSFFQKEEGRGVESLQTMTDSSKKAFFREFKKVVKAADVILEVLDARDPLGCRCLDVEQMIITQDPNKKIILILNKIDLVPKENVEKWLKYLRNDFPTLAFKCSTQKKGKIAQSTVSLQSASSTSNMETSECLGADALIQLLKNYSRSLNMKTSITVGIIGYPNVGKSSLINSLKRERAVGVGATPGYTRAMQEVHIDKHVKLLDCPGIVFSESSSESDLVLRNCIKVEQITDTVKPVDLILSRCRREKLMELYKIPIYHDTREFLCHIAHKRGKLGKGGVPEYEAAARTVLQDWNSGKIAFYTEPPKERKGIHVSAQVVSQFSEEIKLDNIFVNEDSSVLSGLADTDSGRFMSMGTSVFSSTVDTNLMRHLGTEMEDMGQDDDDDDDDKSTAQQTRYLVRGDEHALAAAAAAAGDGMLEEEQAYDANGNNATLIQQRKLFEDEDKINPQTQKDRKKYLKLVRKMRRKGKETMGMAMLGEGEEEEEDDDGGDDDDDLDDDLNGGGPVVDTVESVTSRLGLFTPDDLVKFLETKKAIKDLKKKKSRKGKQKVQDDDEEEEAGGEGDGGAGMDEEEEELFDVDEMH